MLKLILNFSFSFLFLWSFLDRNLTAKEPNTISKLKSNNSFDSEEREETACNISNFSYWIKKTGLSSIPSGIYPRLTEWVVYADGLIWGGYVQDTIDPEEVSLRVGGQLFGSGTNAGWIEQAGDGVDPAIRVDPAHPRARLYRIVRGWENLTPDMADVIRDAAILNHIDLSEVTTERAQEVVDQYERDWLEWPVDLGAPLIDVNNNGNWDEGEGLANADQIIWFVNNDLDTTLTRGLYGSPPIGLEVQITIWAYNQPGATLGQTVFKRFCIINKSGFQIDSMFVAQWVDPDLGAWSDDLVGCDIDRSLGFVYNGFLNDRGFEFYNLPPPAVGYDFFQGPILYTGNPADSAIFDFGYRSGYKNLPMTSFGYYSSGSPIDDPDGGEYRGTLQWYNMLNGFLPTDNLENPSPYIVGAGPDKGQPTKFPLSGDPFLQTGDIDAFGDNFAPGDRRFNLCSGPFNMAPGDTQEVVVALIGGIITEAGGNNRNAVAQLKLNDDYAQFLYDNLFQGIPKPPTPAPAVKFTELTDKIILNWGSDPDIYSQTEKNDPVLGFNFEGYNIYQLPSKNATKSQATLVKTFDKVNFITTIRAKKFLPEFSDIVTVPVQQGTDSGIQRYFVIEKDYINDRQLYAGSKYYFAVTAYNYNADPNVPEPSLESSLDIIEVIPQPPSPGMRYADTTGNELKVDYSQSSGDGQVQVYVVDPGQTTGDTYEIFFREDEDTSSITYGELLWSMRNSIGDINIKDQAIAQDFSANNQQIVDGLKIIVSGPQPEIKSITEVFWGGEVVEPPDNVWHSGNSTSDYYISAGGGDGSISRLERFINFAIPRDFELRFTQEGGFGIHIFTDLKICSTPFELWDITNNIRMIPFISQGGDSSLSEWGYATGIDPAFEFPASDWIYWFDPEEGTNGYDDFANACIQSGGAGAIYDTSAFGFYVDFSNGFVYPIGRVIICDFSGDGLPPPAGTTIRFITSKPITKNDKFTFKSGGSVESSEIAKEDVDKIKVFPNPYYAYHSQETNREERFITFTHLPDKAIIRIFNLAGRQVRKLEKIPGDGTGQFLKWDLNNDSGLPVAGGFYIAYIEMPDLNKTKAVKFFILQRKIF